MITKYGYDVVIVVVMVALIGTLISWIFIEWEWLRIAFTCLFIGLVVFTLNFFRDPDRTTPQDDKCIISPADGTVVLIRNVEENEYLHAAGVQVSIFMSPLNVHVNRYPINGTVGYFKHIPGEFLVAYEEKSSTRNERTHIGIEGKNGKVFFKQIAGFVARRIVAPISVGDVARAGERFGMIKFGSRVDVIVPKPADVKVKIGDKTVAGETVIAT
ncbi:MAG: phosphatidylserine decarboxylase family protein, partial [bacterium]